MTTKTFIAGPRQPWSASWWPRVVVVGLLGTVLMLPGIGSVSLWTDEAATVSAATRSVPELVRMSRTVDVVHLVYYLVMHGWTTVFGTGAVALRLPSAIAVGVAASGLAVLLRRWSGQGTALLAALVFVVLPRTTWMGIEARPYALSAALAVWWCVCFVRAGQAQRSRAAWWALSAAIGGLAVATNLYAALLLPVQALVILLDRPSRTRLTGYVLASAGALALSAGVVLTALGQTGQIGAVSRDALGWTRTVLVNQWFLGDTPTVGVQEDTGLSGWGDLWKPCAVLLAGLSWLVTAAATVRGRHELGQHKEAVVLLGGWVVIPTVALLAQAALSTPLYNPRYLSFCTPAVAGVLALALRTVPRGPRLVVLALALVTALPVYVSQRTVHAKSGSDWSEIATFVEKNRAPGDGVYFSPRYPPTRTEVGLTTRFVAVAYPGAFQGMQDVTIQTTAVQSGDLLGRSRLLADSRPELRGLTAVWVVRRDDYPQAARSADEQVLRSSGFEPTDALVGPVDSVTRWVAD